MKRAVSNLIIVIIVVSAVFTSCKKDNDETYTVSGVITSSYSINWTDASVGVSFDEGEIWAAKAKILMNGVFSIKLPIPDEKNLETLSLPDGVYASESDVRMSEAKFYVRIDDKKGLLEPYTVRYFYVDKDVYVCGKHIQTFVEGKISSTSIYELVMRKGWNIVLYELAEETPPAHSTKFIYTTHQSPAPSNVVWWVYGLE